ncbi:MAG: hypothetical protein M1814_006561 [Vezdaea aestivalis]|nr:MAG: hypothetical protein M1814_006561 [Vezdaea aestivalis]
MGSKEYSRLSAFLLPPASLPAISTLDEFTELFPSAYRKNAEIPHFYRQLQHQRALVTDQVKENIAAEAKKGLKQTREMTKTRRRAERGQTIRTEDDAKELRTEVEMFGPGSNLPTAKPHTLRSIIPELESACEDVTMEIEEMDADIQSLLQDIQATVGALSDLKYGKLGRTSSSSDTVRTETIESLKELQGVCDDVSNE